ncbi:[FeFe] hydrogenase H-cluster radical SAM maturase HydE [Sporanaerobacter acetigenes]|uniref:[FeFe] hydrogenase H-cluster radical SAM maturase HydE n=1 Tax=Sporanaerobacter acetigenes TaxID=165813 RepID=UPI00331D55B9
MKKVLDKLYKTNSLSKDQLIYILNNLDKSLQNYLFQLARDTTIKIYGNKVFIRGLLEYSNHCKHNCMYCGIRRDNKNVDRYRLSEEEILLSLEEGYKIGYKTFVLQGGEDLYFTDDIFESLILKIKKQFPDVAVTLSIGERSYESYDRFHRAGADRFLLRHEVANVQLYNKLHPGMNFENRKNCLYNLKKIGYQEGAGFLVGLPGENNEILAENLIFLKNLAPAMVGIGPLIPHPDTPLKDEKVGSAEKTIVMLSLTRLLLPTALIPITTALNTICEDGLERGLMAGGNVVMLNLSPIYVRKKYEIYKNKETRDAHELKTIEEKAKNVGFVIDMGRGDNINFRRNEDGK